jgi:MoCo/4Fe-4S cofactor protein with predicted Tat translocation signal
MFNVSPMSNHPSVSSIREKLQESSGKDFWKGLDELGETEEFKEFLEKEFPRQAAPLAIAVDRRAFLKLLGASLAFAGLSACARPGAPNEKIVPYVKAPEEIIPGQPLFFSTAVANGGYAEGVLVESHQGRPTKIEGNPDHPASLGATSARTQATVLSVYDPDRSQFLSQDNERRTWLEFTAALTAAVEPLQNGVGLALLTETVTSPTLGSLIDEVLGRYPGAKWYQYDPTHDDAAAKAAEIAFGRPVSVQYDFSQANVILSLDADFTNEGPGNLRYAKEFSQRRRVRHAGDDMNRLYQLESYPSPTGALADHRIALGPSQIASLTATIARRLGLTAPEAEVPEGTEPLLEAILSDLLDNRGKSLVLAGPNQTAEIHVLAHAINEALDNVGTTVSFHEPVEFNPVDQAGSLESLSTSLSTGDVDVLLILGGNPAYNTPAGFELPKAISKVPFSVHLGDYKDETGALTTWHVNRAHYLETWGDSRAFDGTVTIQQPLISPFYGGHSDLEVLSALVDRPTTTSHDTIQSFWGTQVSGNFNSFWRSALHSGTVKGTAAEVIEVRVDTPQLSLPINTGLRVLIRPDPSIWDGRHSNNGWLQELPKPFNKITWENAAYLSPATAEELGVKTHQLVTLSVGTRRVTVPVWVQPGQAKDTVVLNMGYGRRKAGRIGTGIGVDAFSLLDGLERWDARVEIAPAKGSSQLATTQVHQSLDGTGERRHIIRSGTIDELNSHPNHVPFVHPVKHDDEDLYPDFEYTGYAWGMVIDMTVCNGCNACITACQAENNIPIVGKDQVLIGRELHWIRVDNYYRGDIDDPEIYQQPMLCQHCEKAPCEPVCPVGATVHDHEGLNVMVYNRCVGTRYCSNNCPYKVRRFNFLQYAELDTTATELSLANNPDVTVRSRGVMEKCTYCTQRISKARIQANNEDRQIRDGDVVTACQGACPMEAIVFGDINDPVSEVSLAKASPLNYTMLEELQTKPRTSYLAKVSNPHPLLGPGRLGDH